jgi:hypothetical protein
VRAEYVDKPDDANLVAASIKACCPRSTRIRPTWRPKDSGTCRRKPAGNSAVSASSLPRLDHHLG